SDTLLTSPPEWPRTTRPGLLLAARHPARDECSEPPAPRGLRWPDRDSGIAPPRARAWPRRSDGCRDRPQCERASARGRALALTDAGAPSPWPASRVLRSRRGTARAAPALAAAHSRTRRGC